MHEQTDREIAARGVTRHGDFIESTLSQPSKGGFQIFDGSRKRMLRSKPACGKEDRNARGRCEVPRQMTIRSI